jgi:hypothetical protein
MECSNFGLLNVISYSKSPVRCAKMHIGFLRGVAGAEMAEPRMPGLPDAHEMATRITKIGPTSPLHVATPH